ncbi:MAG: DUF115 domain-containing protein [Deltaproteobacteria bacterium]|nr:DUF115 domain-containing protein [Deltaproteobacteria bacterium]
MDSRPVFEQNLAALRKRNPTLAARLEETSGEGVELVAGPRGDLVLRERGVLLGSAYDPRRDGLRLAEQMAESPADILVAVGLGLGEQIEAYCAKQSATVLVYEPSLARLKAALSRLPLARLIATNRDLHFVADLDQLTTVLNARYVPGLCIRVFPHPAVLRLDPSEVAAAVERTKRVKDAADTRIGTSVGQLMSWAWITAGNGRRIAESADFGRMAGAFRGKPAVIAAAGPSLDKQLPLLRAQRDRVVVIAIGQTLKALRRAGIEPDLVHVLESKDVSQQLTGAGETRDLCVALTPDAHSAIYDVPVRALFTATTGASPMGTWIAKATGETRFTMGGGTVAQGAVGLAVLMGCNPILLIGQDLAFTEGRAYAAGSAYDFVRVELAEDGTCAFTDMIQKASLVNDEHRNTTRDKVGKGRIVWVDGWNEGERVPTWRAYASFIEQYRDIGLGLAQRGFQLVNCTEGGARIPMIEHRPFGEALASLPEMSIDARTPLLAGFDERPRRTLEDYRDAIRTARRRLDELEREVEKARSFEKRTSERLANARNDQQRLEILRGIARCEKKIRGHLERAPWLDALVQPEIFAALANQRRSEHREIAIEDLVAEARFLIEAAGNGVERARAWFDRFEGSFVESATTVDTSGEAIREPGSPALAASGPASLGESGERRSRSASLPAQP